MDILDSLDFHILDAYSISNLIVYIFSSFEMSMPYIKLGLEY